MRRKLLDKGIGFSLLAALAIAGVFVAVTAMLLAASAADKDKPRGGFPPPIDPQRVQDQDIMTWADYRPIPGRDWADPALKPKRGFRLAVVAIDFPDQPFVITMPRGSDPFGNPQIDPVARESVPRFYADFFMKPGAVNHGHTINGYWMEQSRGRFGITEVDVFGPFRMPKPRWFYGLNEWGQNDSTPDGTRAAGRMEEDCDAVWTAAAGQDLRGNYDAILRLYASYDETGVWQEFGEMKFNGRDDIPPAWGNPDPAKPRWIPTRYVPWTSWLAGSQQWGLSSMRQAENSGTIAHELGHFAFDLPDLNNNPYVKPYRRVAAGTWDMMDRGCFNGPGGPHRRWVVPPIQGAAMPAGLMVRNRLKNGFIGESELLRLGRDGLAKTGLAAARVTARAVDPLAGACAGIVIRLDGAPEGDRTPADDPAANPLSPGTPNYDFYTLEVVQRIGYDSFTPDNGVLIAKNKDSLQGRNGGPNAFNSYIWVIDAHPDDIHMMDYVKPNGEKVMRTAADYRQLNDALFHAGLDSGSLCEWEDAPNRLHFYVVDLEKDKNGILTYTLAVRSLDDAGTRPRGVALASSAGDWKDAGKPGAPIMFVLSNTGEPTENNRLEEAWTKPSPSNVQTDVRGQAAATRPLDVPHSGITAEASGTAAIAASNFDVYRLSVSVEGKGWTARLLNGLAAVACGGSSQVAVYIAHEDGCAQTAIVKLQATSESDTSKTATAIVSVSR